MDNSARIEELERKFNENPRRYFAPLANEFRKAGNIQRAIAICREFVPQQSGHMSGHIVFGQALFEDSNYVEARAVFSTALDLDPENLLALRHLGDIARLTGDNAGAIAWYRRVLEVDPRNEDAAALLATLTAPQATAPAALLLSYDAAAPTEAPASISSDAAGWGTINPEQTRDLALDSLTGSSSKEPGAPLLDPETATTRALSGSHDEHALLPVDADVTLPTIRAVEQDPVLAGLEAEASTPPPAPVAPPLEPGPEAQTPEPEAHIAEASPPPPAAAAPPAQVTPASPQPPAFVTETMAQLYLQQGHRKEALEVYRQLVLLRPHEKSLRDKVAELEHEPAPAAGRRPRTAREFFAAFATGVPGAPVAREPVVVAPAPPPPVAAQAAVEVPLPPPPELPAAVGEPVVAEAPPVAEPTLVAAPAPDIPPPPPPMPTVQEPTPPDVDAFVPETYDHDVADLDAMTSDQEHYAVDDYGASSLGSKASDRRSMDFEYDQTMDLADLSGSNEYHDNTFTFEPPASSPSKAQPEPSRPPLVEARADEEAPVSETPAAPPSPARRAQTGSVSVLFPGMSVPGVDEAAAATLAGAFGGMSLSQAITVPVPAVRPAPSELSLDSIFGGDEVAVEAEQFTSWLAGLKKK